MDNFTTSKKPTQFFLLTHAHADHLKGLDSGGFSGHTIYCSEITKELIKQNPKYNKNLTSMKTLEENERHKIKYKDQWVFLTLIPARHCPGAVMFLIENDKSAVLLTGDIRAESDWVDSLPKNDILFDYMTSSKQLDNVYLDTTYGYRGEPFIEMNSNSFGLQSLVELLKLYPQDDDDISFYFADSTIGYEEVWIQMVKNGHLMHVPPDLNKRLKMLSTYKDYQYHKRIHKIASSSPHSKFHCCGIKPENCSGKPAKFPVRIKHCIDINIKDLMRLTLPLSLKNHKHEAEFVEELPSGAQIYKINDLKYLKPSNSEHLLRNELRFFFSRHSSYEECRHFVSMFNVKQVFPLTESPITWEQGFQMKRQFGDLCTSEEFLYDSIYSKKYGSPPLNLNQPFIVNKWNESLFLRSWNNDNNIKTTMASGEFHILGQQTIRNQAFRKEFDDEEKQVMKEQKSLVHKNRILCGVNQYRVADRIRTDGHQCLQKYKNLEQDDSQNLQDTFDETQDNDSMTQAAYRENQLRSRNVSVYEDHEVNTSINQPNEIMTSTVLQVKQTNILNSSPAKVLQSPFVPTLRPPTIEVDQVESQSSSPKRTLIQLQKRILSSPYSPIKKSKRTKVSLSNIQKIAKSVINDENFGFFQYHLKCCNESPKKVIHLEID